MPDTSALHTAIDALAFGRRIQGGQIRAMSENVANADSAPATPGGTPYARKIALFRPIDTDRLREPVGRIVRDSSDFRSRYDPSNPAADRQGQVRVPNVNLAQESAELQRVIRSYELNLNASASLKTLTQATIDLLG